MYRSDLLRAKKAAKNYSVHDLCRGAKLSPMTLQKIMEGKENIKLDSLIKLAEFLEISQEDLFGDRQIERVI